MVVTGAEGALTRTTGWQHGHTARRSFPPPLAAEGGGAAAAYGSASSRLLICFWFFAGCFGRRRRRCRRHLVCVLFFFGTTLTLTAHYDDSHSLSCAFTLTAELFRRYTKHTHSLWQREGSCLHSLKFCVVAHTHECTRAQFFRFRSHRRGFSHFFSVCFLSH